MDSVRQLLHGAIEVCQAFGHELAKPPRLLLRERRRHEVTPAEKVVRLLSAKEFIKKLNRTTALYTVLVTKDACQDLGFSLAEITELLELRARSPMACEVVEGKAWEKIAVVETKIGELERIKGALEALAADCARRASSTACPILEALETDEQE